MAPHRLLLFFLCVLHTVLLGQTPEPTVFVWRERWRGWDFLNFGDELSQVIVEKIVNQKVEVTRKKGGNGKRRLFAIGSILSFAADNDIVWGSGINGRLLDKKFYQFRNLDIRAVRGPLTRHFMNQELHIECPEIYGDPALLFPLFFPEYKRKDNPSNEYIIIPHFSEEFYFPQSLFPNVVFPTQPWNVVIEKILDSKLVISSSLHGIILAEAYGIPARLLRITENESLFKYQDYYLGTGRPHFQIAYSVEQALEMGGESPFQCDLNKLLNAFPFEFWEKK